MFTTRSIVQSAHHNIKRYYSAPAYFVSRTVNKGIPVYTDYKNGGTRLLTVIRKVQGDSLALMEDLQADFPEAEITRNYRTRHVLIKGNHVNEIKEWLIAKGF
ncbi:mitochondrial large subunit ribosomal protein-domain-containing protein [Cokeromyces recurvatus]|uniref:mitochondrial large subunit ribosomal protein-domain-containing protein n=1 Tax=Cokeromyces recurvatus TaxID=90255 RepID=UPI00221F9920|nr:mitochondrial large subunit ribosomal protein-domain-containing protein [Cokeromyces recurvatus]KAI7899493.1 mitochondrial large subunit ribosomal protein-domain-containing protein [Cokeromyces recurvatus]